MSVGVTHIPRTHTSTYIKYSNPEGFAERPAKKGPAPVFLFLLSMEFFHVPVRLKMLKSNLKVLVDEVLSGGTKRTCEAPRVDTRRAYTLPLYSLPTHTLGKNTHEGAPLSFTHTTCEIGYTHTQKIGH